MNFEEKAEKLMQLLEKECHVCGSSRRVAVEYISDSIQKAYTQGVEDERKKSAALIEALEHAERFCLCTEMVKGFSYGEEHKTQGKAPPGKRWIEPRYKIKKALAAYRAAVDKILESKTNE